MEYVTSVMKNVLSSRKVVQLFLMYALQKKIWKRAINQYSNIVSVQASTHMFLFVTQAFCFFVVRIWVFWCAIFF